MGEVVLLEAASRSRDARVQSAWAAYCAARDRAERSNDIADGIAAGKAWARFLDLFRAPEGGQ